MMLVLSRQRDESIIIDCGGRLIKLMIVDIRGNKIKLGFEADPDIAIHRGEVWHAIQHEKAQSKGKS